MSNHTGRPAAGGNGGARPRSAVREAAEAQVARELPFPLPATPAQHRDWAGQSLTPAQVRAAVDSLAAAGLVKVKRRDGRLTALRAATPASTIAAEPAAGATNDKNGEPTP